MRFLIDMALSPQLGVWLAAQGHDVVHASQLSLSQAPDTESWLWLPINIGSWSPPIWISQDSSQRLARAAPGLSCFVPATTTKPKCWNAFAGRWQLFLPTSWRTLS